MNKLVLERKYHRVIQRFGNLLIIFRKLDISGMKSFRFWADGLALANFHKLIAKMIMTRIF